MTESLPRRILRFVADFWKIVIYQPVRFGTLDFRAHASGVSGITLAVSVLYFFTVGSILFANPIRATSEFRTSVDEFSAIAVPTLLLPAVLSFFGVAVGLLLAGSQRSPWWRRVLYLTVSWGALASFVGVGFGLGASTFLSWVSAGFLFAVLLYVVIMWIGRTPTTLDALVLVVLCSGLLLTAYRSLILQSVVLGSTGSELTAASLVLSQVSTLALPLAFLAGVNATALGVTIVSWSGEELGRRFAVWFGFGVIVIALGWQWWSLSPVIGSGFSAFDARPYATAAIVVLGSGIAWWACHRKAELKDPSQEDLADTCITVAVPLSYGITAPVVASALLAALATSLSFVLPEQAIQPLASALDFVGTVSVTSVVRAIVIVGLIVAAVVLTRRRKHLIAAVAGVDAVVLGSFFLTSQIGVGWRWSPAAIGDVGLVIATVIAILWTVQRKLDKEHVAFLLTLTLLSALIRQVDFFALPIGFLIGASATALLIVGLVWGYLTDGEAVHSDAPGFPRDRRMLNLLGSALFGITVLAWGVIGKNVGITQVLSEAGAQGLTTLGSALVIVVVLAAAAPWIQSRRIVTSSREPMSP